MSLSPIQKGRIAEMVVGAAIMHASDGRLAPFVPLADDDGLDLILFDRLSGVTTPIQVKARYSSDIDNSCEFNIKESACRAHYNGYLLAVYVDPKTMAFECAWLVPINALPSVAKLDRGKFVLRGSMARDTRDVADAYRHYSVDTIVAKIAPPATMEPGSCMSLNRLRQRAFPRTAGRFI